MKKTLLLLTTLLLSTAAFAGDRLEELRNQRNDAVERAVEPINDRYVADLRKLLKVSMASGDLDEAVAVREEIALFTNETGPHTAQELTEERFEEAITGSVWTFDDPSKGQHRTVFEKRGVLRIFKRDDRGKWEELSTTREWKILDPASRTLEIKWYASTQTVTVSENLDEITGGMKNWVIATNE